MGGGTRPSPRGGRESDRPRVSPRSDRRVASYQCRARRRSPERVSHRRRSARPAGLSRPFRARTAPTPSHLHPRPPWPAQQCADYPARRPGAGVSPAPATVEAMLSKTNATTPRAEATFTRSLFLGKIHGVPYVHDVAPFGRYAPLGPGRSAFTSRRPGALVTPPPES